LSCIVLRNWKMIVLFYFRRWRKLKRINFKGKSYFKYYVIQSISCQDLKMSWFTFLNKFSSSWLQGFCQVRFCQNLEEDLRGSLQRSFIYTCKFYREHKESESDLIQEYKQNTIYMYYVLICYSLLFKA